MAMLDRFDTRVASLTGSGRVFGAAFALLAATAFFLAGCGQGEDAKGAASGAQAPAPSVIAVPAASAPVEEEARFVGRVVATDRVDLRARVPGFLKERRFTEGQEVKSGDLLFLIEPDQYESTVEQRKADLAKAEAEQLNAKAQLARGQELLKSKNISAAEVDKLKAAGSVAEASVAQAKAALAAAELDLSYTRITAPVSGRIGLAKYTVGNLVGPDAGPLATIVSRDPIYVQFPVTQRELLKARKEVMAKGGDPLAVVVRVRLSDGTLYPQSGRLNFVDVTTDQGTDSVTLRAELPNPDGLLVDGQFADVVLQSGTPETAILVPQSALQVDQQGVYVLIVDQDKKAQIRRIRTGQSQGAEIVVASGLKEGELVISEGAQKVRPGQAVSATPPQSVKSEAAL